MPKQHESGSPVSAHKSIAAEPQGKGKASALKGMGFEEQMASLRPEQKKGLGATLKGGLRSMKDTLTGAVSGGLDKGRAGALSTFTAVSATTAGQAQNFVIHLERFKETVDPELVSYHKEGIRKAGVALGMCRSLVKMSFKVDEAAASFMKTGDAKAFEKVLQAYLKLAGDIHEAILGHRGPGDHLANGSFLINPMTGMRDGRTTSKAGKGTETLTGQQTDLDTETIIPNEAANGKMDKEAMTNYAVMYAQQYQALCNAAVMVM